MVTPTKVRVRDVGELLRVLPYSLGFHPGRCAMCVVVEEGGRMGLVQRLPVPDGGWGQVPTDVLGACGRALLGPAGRTAVLIGWEHRPGESFGGLAMLARLCASRGVGVDDAIVVRGERWWRLTGSGATGPGQPVPPAAGVAAIAEFVGLGRAPLPDRADLDTLFDARDDTRSAGVAAELAAARRRYVDDPRGARVEGLRAWTALARGARHGRARRGDPVAGTDPRLIGAALAWTADRVGFDALLGWLVPAMLTATDEGRAATGPLLADLGRCAADPLAGPEPHLLLCDLARTAPPGSRAPILVLCGVHAWARGNGPVAETATRLALVDDGRHALARTMYAAIRGGISLAVALDAVRGAASEQDAGEGPPT